MHSTDNVDDVHRVVAGVGNDKKAGGGGAREGHPARGAVGVVEQEPQRGR